MNCRVCDSRRLELALDLGDQPWANQFVLPAEAGSEPTYPLHLVHCADCGTAQLDYTVPKETLFGDHTYLSGITQTLDRHFAAIAEDVDGRFGGDGASRAILDIGSNDGTQLRHFQRLGYQVLGVDSSITTARLANERGVETTQAFFNEAFARDLGRQFDVINAAGVFFHLEELHSATEGIRTLLRPDGVFVVQCLYMKQIVENVAFDQVYHEHLLYYTVRTLRTLLERHGLEMFDCRVDPIHGGSLVAFVGHPGRHAIAPRLQTLLAIEDAAGANTLQAYRRFARRIAEKKTRNLAFLHAARAQRKRIFGFGAPVKGNTLLNYFGIGRDLIECLVEKNTLRRGLVSPGGHIPVVIESELTDTPDVYYVLAWNFRDEILRNNQRLIEAGVDFFFPVDVTAVAAAA